MAEPQRQNILKAAGEEKDYLPTRTATLLDDF